MDHLGHFPDYGEPIEGFNSPTYFFSSAEVAVPCPWGLPFFHSPTMFPRARVYVPTQSVQFTTVLQLDAGLPLQGGKLHPSVVECNRSAKPIRTGSNRFILW